VQIGPSHGLRSSEDPAPHVLSLHKAGSAHTAINRRLKVAPTPRRAAIGWSLSPDCTLNVHGAGRGETNEHHVSKSNADGTDALLEWSKLLVR
jgi:hypothetical protein